MKDTPPHTNVTPTPPIQRPALRFDWEDWLPYFDDEDASLEQKRELIETLWSIVVGFVDLGFDIKPDAETCGEGIDLKAALEAAVVNSMDTQTLKEATDDT